MPLDFVWVPGSMWLVGSFFAFVLVLFQNQQIQLNSREKTLHFEVNRRCAAAPDPNEQRQPPKGPVFLKSGQYECNTANEPHDSDGHEKSADHNFA
jgi:hypothetical protein